MEVHVKIYPDRKLQVQFMDGILCQFKNTHLALINPFSKYANFLLISGINF